MSILNPRPRLIEPGLRALPPGMERYRIAGGGALVVEAFVGDDLTLVDVEGRQIAELAVFARDGRADPHALGLNAISTSPGINRLLVGEGEEVQMLSAALSRRGIPQRIDRAARLFGADSPAGAEARLTAERDCVLIVHATGGPAIPEEQTAPTDLILFIRRARIPEKTELVLPPPLAEPRLEFRVPRASALAYEVAEGEYIQVIDVEGRQCSDFVALDARLLDKGIERGFDMTATRTMTGLLYPMPGLASKYFSTELQPLVEVVRDTCGRHDSFGLACTPRFYEDQGYPGHPSCSGNFNP